MKKLYCIIYGKYRKFEKSKILYICEETLVLSISCSKFKSKNKDENYLKKKNQLRYKNSWLNWKHIITLKIWFKKTLAKNFY